MAQSKHKVFISYYHQCDQNYKGYLIAFNDKHDIFIDKSVDTGDIDENLNDQSIRQIIRDDYLKDSTVTIVLVGTETKKRKHVDWEIYSSMYDGTINKKSGVLVINLPSTGCTNHTAAHGNEEKSLIYPNSTWGSVKTRTEYESRYSHMPDRIIDNLLIKDDVKISVTSWDKLTVGNLSFLIDATYNDRAGCGYDLSRSMRRSNS